MKSLTRAAWTLLVIALIVLYLYTPQLVQALYAYSAKTGQVIDADTGLGIGQAYVIAVVQYHGSGFGHTTIDYRSRFVVQTDDDGDYSIPADRSKARFTEPYFNPRTDWSIVAYKHGYINDPDRKSALQNDLIDRLRFEQESAYAKLSARWGWGVLEVEPVALNAVKLTERQDILYFKDIGAFGLSQSHKETSADIMLRDYGRSIFQPVICGMDPNTVLDQRWGYAYLVVAKSFGLAADTLKRSEPQGFRDSNTKPIFHAANVCDAIK